MTGLFTDSNAAWAAVIIVLLPLLIIGTGEFEERLRQRDSEFRDAVSTLRVWVVPLVTIWVLSRALFDLPTDNPLMRLLGSAIVLSGAVAALSASYFLAHTNWMIRLLYYWIPFAAPVSLLGFRQLFLKFKLLGYAAGLSFMLASLSHTVRYGVP